NGNVVTSSSVFVSSRSRHTSFDCDWSSDVCSADLNGVATFSDLSIDKAGTGYTLSASSTGLTGATSNTFNISAGSANKLAFSVQIGRASCRERVSPSVKVETRDTNGNVASAAASAS